MFCSLIGAIVISFFLYHLFLWILSIPRLQGHSDRFVFITGCDSGFGNLLAKRMDRLGCHVIAGCLTERGESELRKESSSRLETVGLDVTRAESVRGALRYVQSKLPPGKGLWGLVNNAGCLSKIGPNDWMSVDDYKRQCDVNLWGVIDVTLTFLPLVKRAKGRVVIMSSAAGRISSPLNTTYSLSKYGVECFSDGIRRDLRSFGCKVSIIEPGGFKTTGATPEVVSRAVTNAWTDASPEMKEEYGQEYYDFLRKDLVEKLTATFSDRLDRVIDAYEHALVGRFPRARYVVGLDAWLLFIGLHALPEWAGDLFWGLMEKTRPTPNVFRKR